MMTGTNLVIYTILNSIDLVERAVIDHMKRGEEESDMPALNGPEITGSHVVKKAGDCRLKVQMFPLCSLNM